jgi:O-antigen ligase
MSAPTDRASPARDTEPAIAADRDSRALAVLIIAVVAMAVLPQGVQYLIVEHRPFGQSPPRFPLATAVSGMAAVVLFLVCAVILIRFHPDRKLSRAIVLLLALVIPYIINPALPGTAAITRVALAAAVILAVWNLGASVDGLKWVAISGSVLGTYSIIEGLILPEYAMTYNAEGGKETIIANWCLAGPLANGNSLGIFCAVALALTPLIGSVRWRILHGSILCTAIAASASRTALIAAGVLVLWWIISYSRSVKFVRIAGQVLLGCCATSVLVLPLLGLNRYAFTGRAQIWAVSLHAWEESRLVGLGIDWFTTTAKSLPIFANWDDLSDVWIPPHGHNLVVDTLVKSGLVGICLVVLVLLAAIRSTRSLDISSHQIACFGYLIVFLVISVTEAIWVLLPNYEMFPLAGLVFAVLIAARHDVKAGTTEQSADT